MATDPVILGAAAADLGRFSASSKHFARLLLTIGENRLELLMAAVQEERELLLRAVLLAFGVAAFGLLAGMTFTAALVLLLRAYSPVAVLLTLAFLYGAAGFCLYRRFVGRLHDEQPLAASLDQLRKDRAGLENLFQ
ncbi:MAG: hypothetical protein A2X46_19380 [Lentisphaerae bacterium GWF2_57_35]|nr:MAG: hypothetical protein A2X46_19380 [Lentisphaerae bacterium GWF2_57_35]